MTLMEFLLIMSQNEPQANAELKNIYPFTTI